jgi:hypothetical protein
VTKRDGAKGSNVLLLPIKSNLVCIGEFPINSKSKSRRKQKKRQFMNKASFYLIPESQQLTHEAETESTQNENIQKGN